MSTYNFGAFSIYIWSCSGSGPAVFDPNNPPPWVDNPLNIPTYNLAWGNTLVNWPTGHINNYFNPADFKGIDRLNAQQVNQFKQQFGLYQSAAALLEQLRRDCGFSEEGEELYLELKQLLQTPANLPECARGLLRGPAAVPLPNLWNRADRSRFDRHFRLRKHFFRRFWPACRCFLPSPCSII
ncbi:MAG: hypothetical protein IPM81_09845 [Saprospirales bacterium]|nr:hypothetical protein [Saprospirales bacterium]